MFKAKASKLKRSNVQTTEAVIKPGSATEGLDIPEAERAEKI